MNKVQGIDFSKSQMGKYTQNLYKSCEQQLNRLHVNADGRHYGYNIVAAQTGVGKSYAAIQLGIEKVRIDHSRPQIIYVSKKKNNLPSLASFPEDVKKYAVRIKSNDESVKTFVENNHLNLADKKPKLDEYLKDFTPYLDVNDMATRDNPILERNLLESPHTLYNFTFDEFCQILEELDRYGYKVFFNNKDQSQESIDDNIEKQKKYHTKVRKILTDLLFKILAFEQKRNPDAGLFTSKFQKVSYADIKAGKSVTAYKNAIKTINYPAAYRFIYRKFKIVRDLFSQVAFSFSPISIVTTQKLFFQSNLLLHGYNHLYDSIEKHADPIFIVDENVETKEVLNKIIAENAQISSNLLYVAEPLNNLITNNDIPVGILEADKESTKKIIKNKTRRLRKLFNQYKLQKKIFADESVINHRRQKQTMFASIDQNITTSNKVRIEDKNGKIYFIPMFWIDTREADTTNQLIMRNILYYDFKDNKVSKKRLDNNVIIAQSEKLNERIKNEDYTIYPIEEMIQSLSTATTSTIRKISKAGFGTKYTELENMGPNIEYDDDYALFKQLIRSSLNDKIYQFYDRTVRNNLNVSKYRTYTSIFENLGLSIFNLRILDTREIVIYYSHTNNTAERLWYDFTSKFKVFGVDALGDLKDDPKNFSTVYLDSHLHNHFICAKNVDMAKAIEARLNYEKQQLNVTVIKPQILKHNLMDTLNSIFKLGNENNTFIELSHKLDDTKYNTLTSNLSFLLYEHINSRSKNKRINLFKNELVSGMSDLSLESHEEYYTARWLKRINALLRIIDLFNERPEYRSGLLFINNALKPKEIDVLRKIAAIYSDIKGYEFDENWIDAWSASDFKNSRYKSVLNKELGEGKHKIIFSTYATMAKGQNVNYLIPKDKVIQQKLKFLGVGSDEKDETKDWDCTYLEQPTQLIKRYEYGKPETLIEAIFDLKSLQTIGAVTREEVNHVISSLLQHKEAAFTQYGRPAIQLVVTALICQALGRLNRTNNRLDQTVILDDDLYNRPVVYNDEIIQYQNLCQLGYLKNPDRAFPVLSVLENAVYEATKKSDDIDFDSLREDEFERLSSPDKILQLQLSEKTQDKIKSLISSDDISNKAEQWVAYNFARAYIQANHILNKADFEKHKNFLADMSHIGNFNVDRYITDALKFSLIDCGKYESNQYWVKTDSNGKKVFDVKFNEEFDKNNILSGEIQNHVDLTNSSKIMQLLSIPQFKEYLKQSYPDIQSLLKKKDIAILLNGQEKIRINPSPNIEKVLERRKEYLLPILKQKIDWDNYGGFGYYLPTLAAYKQMVGYLGELAAQYILNNFVKLTHTGTDISLVDYDTPEFLDNSLKQFTEVADFASKNSTLKMLCLFDIKQWSASQQPRELYLNKGRINKINTIASLEGVEHVNYVFINVLRMRQSHHLKIIGPYPVEGLPNVSFYEVPMLYDYRNNSFIGDTSYQYQISEFLRNIEENNRDLK